MSAKVKLANDFPPFRMKLENGHMVPLTPHDAERLDSFNNGRDVLCYFTQEPPRNWQRRWYAVIGTAVKLCDTPWRDQTMASDAIKLAIGWGKPFKRLDGSWAQTPRSLNEADDAKMKELFDMMVLLLERITGVDPLTLKAETASTDAPEEHPSDAEQSRSAEETSPESPPADVETDDSHPTSSASPDQNSEDLSSSQVDGDAGRQAEGDSPPPESSSAAAAEETTESGSESAPETGDAGDAAQTSPAGGGPTSPDQEPSPENSDDEPGMHPVAYYAMRLLHTASTIMSEDRFKPLNEGQAKEAMALTVSDEQKKLGKMDKKTKEVVEFTHGVCKALLMGNRNLVTARPAVALKIEQVLEVPCVGDDLIQEET